MHHWSSYSVHILLVSREKLLQTIMDFKLTSIITLLNTIINTTILLAILKGKKQKIYQKILALFINHTDTGTQLKNITVLSKKYGLIGFFKLIFCVATFSLLLKWLVLTYAVPTHCQTRKKFFEISAKMDLFRIFSYLFEKITLSNSNAISWISFWTNMFDLISFPLFNNVETLSIFCHSK